MIKKQGFLFLIIFLMYGFMLFATSDQSHAGFAQIEERCCQLAPDDCINFSDLPPNAACLAENVVEDAFCNQETGLCTPIFATSSIPTLSEWGLIAMAGVLGIVGYIIVRKRKVNV